MREGWRSQLPFLAFAVPALALGLALICLGSAYGDALEPSYRCELDNCVEDDRSWAARHALLLGVTVTVVVAAALVLVSWLTHRRRVRLDDPVLRWR